MSSGAGGFNVEINDKIAPSIQAKLEAIAKAAGASSDTVKKLTDNINSVGGGPVDSLAKAAERATKSLRDEASAVRRVQDELKALQTVGSRPVFNRNQLLNLGFQLQDIIVSLQAGQKPLTVFIQQGGQIGQVFAQAGASAGQGLAAIGRIILSFINPLTVALGLFVAIGAAVYSFVSFSSDISDFSKRLGISTNQAEALYKSLYKLTGLDISDQKKELTNFGGVINKASRDPNENDVSKLFTENGLSILDANGKLKDFNTNLRQAVTLVQNAKTEFDAIDVGKLLGLSEEFTTSLYRAKGGLDDINKAGGTALDPLKKSAADFDKNASEYWRNFVLYAKSAIQEVGKFLYHLFDNLPTDPIGTLVTKTIAGVKSVPGLIGDAITGANKDAADAGLFRIPTKDNRTFRTENFNDRFNDSFGTNSSGKTLADLKGPTKPGLPTGKPTVVPAPDKKKEPKPKLDVEEDINIKLDQQIARLKLLRPEREIQQQLDEAQNRARRAGKPLSDDELAGIREKIVQIEHLKDVQQAMDSIYDSTVGTMTKYNATVEAGNNLLAKGVITQDQYANAVNASKIKLLESQNTISSGLEGGLLKTVQEYGQTSSLVSQTVTKSFDGLADGLASFASGTKFSFSDLSKSILADVTKMIIRIAVLKPLLSSLTGGFGSLSSIFGGGGGPDGSLGTVGGVAVQGPTLASAGGGFGSLGALFGFATGGEFKVGGSGGTDSQVVQFKASPDETVRVTRPGQSGDGPPVAVNVYNNANATARVEEKQTAGGGKSFDVIVEQLKGAVASDMLKGGTSINTAMQQRYGLNPAAGAR
jgi:lambda family phage tail tape measure protein